MPHLTTDTFARPDDLGDRRDPAVLYARSYLVIRTAVGALGLLLPLVLWAVDVLVLEGSITVRGSLSDYYHSGARDLFVGALCVIGGLLATYLAAQPRTWDFWLSLVAGVAAIVVALFPTQRPPSFPGPATPLQQRLGEDSVAAIHFTSAAVFILSLAALCFVFAHREQRYVGRAGRVLLHRACGAVILAAVAWAAVGLVVDLDIGWLTSRYLAEVASTWAFGLSWLVKGYDLRRLLGLRQASERRTPGP